MLGTFVLSICISLPSNLACAVFLTRRVSVAGVCMTHRQSKDVLIADDDAGIRQLICLAMQRHDLSCDTAANGRQVLECLRVKDYAVLLLDLMMPQLDGFGVLAELASRETAPDAGLIVLVMTAFDERVDLPVIGESVHAVIRKPFDLRELAALVSGCVQTRANIAVARGSPNGEKI